MKREYPAYLSSPLTVLWFETDTMVMIFMGFMFGNVIGGWLWLSIIVLPLVFETAKKTASRGFLKHLLYYAGLVEMKGYPSYFDKDFKE